MNWVDAASWRTPRDEGPKGKRRKRVLSDEICAKCLCEAPCACSKEDKDGA